MGDRACCQIATSHIFAAVSMTYFAAVGRPNGSVTSYRTMRRKIERYGTKVQFSDKQAATLKRLTVIQDGDDLRLIEWTRNY